MPTTASPQDLQALSSVDASLADTPRRDRTCSDDAQERDNLAKDLSARLAKISGTSNACGRGSGLGRALSKNVTPLALQISALIVQKCKQIVLASAILALTWIVYIALWVWHYVGMAFATALRSLDSTRKTKALSPKKSKEITNWGSIEDELRYGRHPTVLLP
jgi:hypothetical protein